MGKKRKTYKHTKITHRHGRTQANKSEHSFTVRVVWPYLSPSYSETYAGCGGMIYATPASAPLQHSSESEARATYITYLYRPIWQHRTPHSHHIHRPHNGVCGCVWVGESTLSVTCHTDALCQCLSYCIYKQLQQIWSSVGWKMSPCSQRHTPAVYVFQIYMLCTLDQIQVTMKIFSPAFCSALVRASIKQHLSSYEHSRESKKVSTKSAGSSPDWLCAPALQSQSVTHPLPLLYLCTMKSRGLGLLSAYTCRLPFRTSPLELFRQFDCVAPSSYKIKTPYRYITTSISPSYISCLSLKIHYAKESPPPNSH